MGKGSSEEAVLDLSAWPQQPAAAGPPRRPSLPPTLPRRPVRRRRLPSVPLGRAGAGLLVLGSLLLAVPVPGTGCSSALSVWSSDPRPLPSTTPPALDDRQVTQDASAVRAATAALTAHDAQVAAARRVLAATGSAAPHRTSTSSAPSGDVSALEAAVREDVADRDRAKAARDQLVEQQQAADDPSAYDADVAAAQEDLDVAEARLADDRQALATAQRAASSAPATAAPSPTPAPGRAAAQAVLRGDAATRAALVRTLQLAQQAEAQHLAQRRAHLSSWAAQHAREVTRVRALNARLASCGGTARTSGGAGALLGSTGAALVAVGRRRT